MGYIFHALDKSIQLLPYLANRSMLKKVSCQLLFNENFNQIYQHIFCIPTKNRFAYKFNGLIAFNIVNAGRYRINSVYQRTYRHSRRITLPGRPSRPCIVCDTENLMDCHTQWPRVSPIISATPLCIYSVDVF